MIYHTTATTRFPGDAARPKHESNAFGTCKGFLLNFKYYIKCVSRVLKTGRDHIIRQLSSPHQEYLKAKLFCTTNLHVKSSNEENHPKIENFVNYEYYLPFIIIKNNPSIQPSDKGRGNYQYGQFSQIVNKLRYIWIIELL